MKTGNSKNSQVSKQLQANVSVIQSASIGCSPKVTQKAIIYFSISSLNELYEYLQKNGMQFHKKNWINWLCKHQKVLHYALKKKEIQ